MSSSSVSPAKIAPVVPRIPARGLPILLTFEGDSLARRMVSRIQRFRRASYDDLPQIPAEVDRVLITSSERVLTEHLGEMRSAKLRIIAVADSKDPQHQQQAHKHLRFKLAQNDSVALPFREAVMEISQKSIAGYVAQTGQPVNIEDAYHLGDDVPYSINRKFDEDSGYRTKSILAVPMRNQKDEIVGVVQLINCKRDFEAKLASIGAVSDQVTPFSARQQEIVASLASQAAVAYENSQLYEAIQRLFEGFVKAAVTAIESRDPTTSGHSFRVANLTVALAETVDTLDTGPYAQVRFNRAAMKEIRYASLLHDFGKVGVREEVLVKAKKLYPAQVDVIRQRFDFVKRSVETEALRSRLDYVLEKGREEFLAKLPGFDQELANQLKEMDDWFETILKANEPTVLAEGSF